MRSAYFAIALAIVQENRITRTSGLNHQVPIGNEKAAVLVVGFMANERLPLTV
jgi:hypothetical protein